MRTPFGRTGSPREAGRPPRRAGARPAGARRAALLGIVVVLSAGCGGFWNPGDIGPDGRSRADVRLRRLLDAGHADSALAWLREEPSRLPGDDVLDHLYFGVVAQQAGLYGESSLWLRAAYELSEDRYTKSVLRSALTLVTNDRVMPYDPGETERLLIHYYNAKNHLALGDPDGAAVEARRLSLMLDRYDDASAPTPRRAAFRAFASSVFAATGEINDADVAARKASAQGVAWVEPSGASQVGLQEPSITLAVPLESIVSGAVDLDELLGLSGSGELVVVVERGRVAQLYEETGFLTLDDHEHDHLSGGRHRRTYASMELARRMAPDATGDREFLSALEEAKVEAEREKEQEERRRQREEEEEERRRQQEAAQSAEKDSGEESGRPAPAEETPTPRRPTLERTGDDLRPGSAPAPEEGAEAATGDDDDGDHYDRNPYIMRVAWAAYRTARRPPSAGPATLLVDEEPAAAARLPVGLSDGVIADRVEAQGWAIARAVARAGAKLAITRAIESEAAEKDETLGRILGAVANAGAVLSERADTRSWALVPDRLEILRVRLPAGEHRVTVRLSDAEAVELGTVVVPAGRTILEFVRAEN
ncbi:MAG: hypothetical protein ABFS34_00535 [Gemmatimonadota bacterium]